jgi:conjugal transfer pilus assembly protein TraK
MQERKMGNDLSSHTHLMTRKKSGVWMLMSYSVSALLCWSVNSHAVAAQFIDARDGDTAIGRLSIKDQTRVKLEKGRITDVIGDVYSKEKNPAGRIIVIPDEEDGEIYIRPTDAGTRPIKIDLRTDRGKFSLLLQPVDIPGDTLILRSRGVAVPPGSQALIQASDMTQTASMAGAQNTTAPIARSSSHVRAVKAMTLAMAGAEVPADVEVRPANQTVVLWRESRFVLTSTYLSRELVGETYELSNVSPSDMVIDEREFYRDGVQSVSVKYHQLAPGAKTAVWIVRSRSAND